MSDETTGEETETFDEGVVVSELSQQQQQADEEAAAAEAAEAEDEPESE